MSQSPAPKVPDYYVVVVPPDEAPYLQQEHTPEALAEFIKSISANPAASGSKIFIFLGYRLFVTKGDDRYLVDVSGKRYPLFDDVMNEEPELDDSFDLIPSDQDNAYKATTETLLLELDEKEASGELAENDDELVEEEEPDDEEDS